MNITLFGGAFNPPHLGHTIVIEQAFEHIPGINELWLLPCYHHTFLKDLAPANHRLAMCKLLMDSLSPDVKPKVRLETVEMDNRLSGETLEALRLLKKTWSKNKFSFLMGTDQLQSFTKWGHWQTLLEEMPFFIYPRAGYTNAIPFPNMTLLTSPTQVVTNLSSTLVRERIEKNLPISYLVPTTNLKYLRINRLYRKNTQD